MNYTKQFRVVPGSKVDLAEINAGFKDKHESHEHALPQIEAYSRKLSKRVSEGYAAKRRRLGVPGGNKMPYGLIREGKPSVLRVDEEQAAVVIRAYQLAVQVSRWVSARKFPRGMAWLKDQAQSAAGSVANVAEDLRRNGNRQSVYTWLENAGVGVSSSYIVTPSE